MQMAEENMVQNAVEPEESHHIDDENEWEDEENEKNSNNTGKVTFIKKKTV